MNGIGLPRELTAGVWAQRLGQYLLAVFIVLLAPAVLAANSGRAPPNIVFVVSDDLGWPYYGFMGNDIIHTPNLDRLAAEGVTFPNGFSTSNVCAPALRSILTGLHPDEFAARNATGRRNSGAALRKVETLPRVLAGAGYRSFQAGKFWEGHYSNAGFTTGLSTGERPTSGIIARAGGASALFGRGEMDALWTFLSEDRTAPFFVWLTPMLPHGPYLADERYVEPYRKLGLSPAATRYYASITRFDAVLGKLLEHLEASGLRGNTLVIYLSDNGYEMEPRNPLHTPPYGGPHGKLSAHDMGFRTPVIITWPGVLPEGLRSEHVVSGVDLFNTSLSAAGVPVPRGRTGHDLWPYLTGAGKFGRSSVVGHVSRLRRPVGARGKAGIIGYSAWFVRTAEWRYVWHEVSGREELFRIEQDPLEEVDVSSAHRAVTQKLRAEARAWKDAVSRVPSSIPATRVLETGDK